jgi:2'-5' RNA ligase
MAKQRRPATPADDEQFRLPGEAGWRLFLALPLPREVRQTVGELSRHLAKRELPVRFVQADLAHITLHFLGEVSPERAELLALALPGAVAGHRAVELVPTRLGVFPNERKPRVLWLGLEGDAEPLIRLHAALRKTLRQLDFEVDDKAFRPHITIGRVRENAPGSLPADIQAAFAGADIAATIRRGQRPFTITEVQLVQSHLEKAGPRYEVRKSLPLSPGR